MNLMAHGPIRNQDKISTNKIRELRFFNQCNGRTHKVIIKLTYLSKVSVQNLLMSEIVPKPTCKIYPIYLKAF